MASANKVTITLTESQWVTLMLGVWDSVEHDRNRWKDDPDVMWAVIDEKVAIRDIIASKIPNYK